MTVKLKNFILVQNHQDKVEPLNSAIADWLIQTFFKTSHSLSMMEYQFVS